MKKNICLVAGIAGLLVGTTPSAAHAEGRMRYHGWGGGSHWGGGPYLGGGSHWGWRGSYWGWGDPYWGWEGPYWERSGGYLVIDTPPDFIVLPGYGFSVTVGTPYDIIYYDNLYYTYNSNYWYSSPAYRGPWVVIHENDLPDIIRRHSIDDIRKARDVDSPNNRNQDNRGHVGDINSSRNLNDTHRDTPSNDNDQTR